MQKNNQIVYETHHIDNYAKPYLYWLYMFAVFPILIMVILSFVETEGFRFDDMAFTLSNFNILVQKSTLIAFLNSLK